MSDQGLYTCNLHHHYCHLDETVKVQLNITKSGKEEPGSPIGYKLIPSNTKAGHIYHNFCGICQCFNVYKGSLTVPNGL